MICVTHDRIEATTLADRIVVMNQGRIEQAGKPLELCYTPANLFVAGFIGSAAMNFFPAADEGVAGTQARVKGPSIAPTALPPKSLAPGARLTIGYYGVYYRDTCSFPLLSLISDRASRVRRIN